MKMLRKLYAWLLSFGIGFLASAFAMDEALIHKHPQHAQHQKQGQHSPFTVIDINGQKIYTATIRLASGEIAYFGFEPIFNEERSQKWYAYKKSTYDYTSAGRLFRNGLTGLINGFDNWKSIFFPKTKKHEQEVLELLSRFPNKKNEKGFPIFDKAIEGIASGTLGFHYWVGDYVAYVSKKPIEGFFPLPDVAPENKDLDAYINDYEDIVMIVSSYSSHKPELFSHRGIFRNLISMLRKDYQGIGLLIHAFAASARSELFPEVKIMSVSPDGNRLMAQLLEDNFKGEEIKKDEHGYDITVEALKKKFLAADIISK